jgi:hypothetical protein
MLLREGAILDRTEENIDPKQALNEIRRLEHKVRTESRWAGWLWLIVGFSTAVFGVFAPPITHGWQEYVVTIGFPILGFVALVYALQQQVISRAQQHLEYPVTWVFCGLVLVNVMFRMIADPTHLSALVIILGTLPVLPCCYGTWRVWRA